MTEEYIESYLNFTYMRSQGNSDHDLTENTYTNYRYYPEMLGAMMKKFVSMSDIVDGAEFVERCEGNRIILKNGVEKAIIRVSE